MDPFRAERSSAWKKVAESSASREAVVICSRGGMRSQIAAQWAREAGTAVSTVQGGIKAIRGELLKHWSPAGMAILRRTHRSGKTELLKELKSPKIDLERLANHRGSSFGRKIRGKRPDSTGRFENLVFLELRRNRRAVLAPCPLEDESTSIGLCFIPRELKFKMNSAPCVWVESTQEDRARRIYSEYIQEPMDAGIGSREVFEWMLSSLERIQKKLGGLETKKIQSLMQEAFRLSDEQGFRPAFHEEWIVAAS